MPLPEKPRNAGQSPAIAEAAATAIEQRMLAQTARSGDPPLWFMKPMLTRVPTNTSCRLRVRAAVAASLFSCLKSLRSVLFVFWWIGVAVSLGAADSHVVRGADELYWVPTLEQGLAMSRVTGRPLFLMGYSLVPDGTT